MVDYVKQDMKLLWAELGDYVAPTNEKITQGWLVEVPPRQYWNWLENRQDKQLAYLTQKGFAEWDNTLEYIINKSYVQHNGVVYKCVRTNTGVTPGTSTLDWVVAFTTSTAASEALKAVTPAANMLPYFTSTTAASTTSLTAFARTILDDADAATVRTTISAQTLNANLTAISGLTSAANKLPYFTGSDTAATTDLSAFGRSLIDDADAAAARNTLGLGSLAVQSDGSISITGGTISGITDLAIADGGTGASTAAGARTNLGLGTAAVANVTTSSTDSTAGRLLKVGDFGLGGSSISWSPASGTIADSANTIQNAFISDGSGSVTDKPAGASAVRWMNIGNSSWPLQLASNAYDNRMWMRTRASASGTFNDWSEFYHTGNVTPFIQSLLDDADAATARATLGANNAANLTTGTLPDARLSGTYTGVNITGNAATATQLATARTINGVSFNGTANITIADATKLPLSGGTLTGTLGLPNSTSITGTANGLQVTNGANGTVEIGNRNTSYTHYSSSTGNHYFYGTVQAQSGFSGDGSGLTGVNAATAAQLATARTINGVSFNGTANITVADSTKLPLAGGTLTGPLIGTRGIFTGTGNDYHLGGLEVDGNGTSNTVFPTIGFHQPGLYASSLQLRAASDFRFYAHATAYANVTAAAFIGNGSQLTALNASNLGSGTVAVTLGGTGVTTSTGSGSNVLNTSPAFAGVPTAPTAASGTNTTQIATTAFVQTAVGSVGGFTQSLGVSGWTKMPNGVILQWGSFAINVSVSSSTTVGSVTFPIAFPTAVRSFGFGWVSSNPRISLSASAVSTTGLGSVLAADNGSGGNRTGTIYWSATGY